MLSRLTQDLREFLVPELAVQFAANDDPLRPDIAVFLPLLRKALPRFRDEGCAGVLAEVGGDDRLVKIIEGLRKKVDEVLPSLMIPPAALAGQAHVTQKIIDKVAAIFVTSSNKIRTFTRIHDADLKALFQVLVTEAAGPILDLLHKVSYIDLLRTNVALLRLGLRLLDIYDGLKRRDRVVDFQDLEDLARRLMGDSARAMSLLYRLDDSLQHILVDEFQDTNFNQWDILEPFVAEFPRRSRRRQPTDRVLRGRREAVDLRFPRGRATDLPPGASLAGESRPALVAATDELPFPSRHRRWHRLSLRSVALAPGHGEAGERRGRSGLRPPRATGRFPCAGSVHRG